MAAEVAAAAAGHGAGAVLAEQLADVKKKLGAAEKKLAAAEKKLDDNKDEKGNPLSSASIDYLQKHIPALTAQVTALQEEKNILLKQQLQAGAGAAAGGGDAKAAAGAGGSAAAAVDLSSPVKRELRKIVAEENAAVRNDIADLKRLNRGAASRGVTTGVEAYEYYANKSLLRLAKDMAEFGIQPRAPLKECQFKAALEAGTKESEVQAYFERWIDAFQGEDGQTERRGCHVFLQSNPGAATIGSRKVDLTVYERPANGDVIRTELRIVTAGELKPRVKTTGATDDFSSEEKGRAVTFLCRLLEFQPFRSFVIGFLSDSARIQFFRLTVKRDVRGGVMADTELLESPVLSLQGEGGNCLMELLYAPFDKVGYELPKVVFNRQPVVLKNVLGRGRYATAYTAEAMVGAGGGVATAVVVKHNAAADAKQLFEREKQMLQRASAVKVDASAAQPVAAIVSTAHGLSGDGHALVVGPVGTRFAATASELTATASSQLLAATNAIDLKAAAAAATVAAAADAKDAKSAPATAPEVSAGGPPLFGVRHATALFRLIAALHQRKIRHNDIKPQNFYLTRDAAGTEVLLLNDFGAATDTAIATDLVRETTLAFASDRVLTACKPSAGADGRLVLQAFAGDDSDDFHAAVRSVYALHNPALFAAVLEDCDSVGGVEKIRRFWKRIALTDPWAALFAAASEASADKLCTLVTRALPF